MSEIALALNTRRQLILDLGFREDAFQALTDYVELLWSANSDLNLISRKMTVPELIDNHVIDCLLPLRLLPRDLNSVADFGSGGGLPGVIYAIHLKTTRFQLFEKSPLKQDFLRRCTKISPNLEVKAEIPLILKDVELVTARAFKPLDVILKMSRDYYLKGGEYFLLKARREKIEEEIELAQKVFPDLEVQVEGLKSPVIDVERHILKVKIKRRDSAKHSS